ncbi:RNA polymerase sigma factor (sigma-70 family) [Micromonospora kangleipakensis]|uniref:RNA polymerase sigma factor (Sigma-70 family) n=1 Tax=Micromonospora kangleipakensis TaxID=1077942 RepID=A0A4Q8BEE0_9ACTN|nr:sigma-70 family RNA polymerase sigma factor [Micromonospora kangleipakensis]RZU76058.1 RNA polymerase sigma factor (sigma-70 family) [Micromonospora kangleipakensis]
MQSFRCRISASQLFGCAGADQAADRAAVGPEWQDSPLVFTTRHGTPIEPRNFNRAWERCRRAGVRRITVHDARRTCASLLVDLDVHPRVAMQILRHADFSMAHRIGEPADDLLAETFLVAFRRRASYRPMQLDVRPWLFGIATNVLHRHVRQEDRRYRALARARLLETGSHADDLPDDRLDAQALRAELAAAPAALKPADRDVLLLAWAQLSYAEIAAALDIPIGTVRSRINRARRLTRAALSSLQEDR